MILADKIIVKLKPREKRFQVFDSKETCLVMRVEPNGRKAFFYLRFINRKQYARAFGEYPQTSLLEARDKAHDLSNEVKKWKESNYAGAGPFAKVEPPKPEPTTPTFEQLVDAYVAFRIRTKALPDDSAERRQALERSEYSVRQMARKYFSAWLPRPIDGFDVKDVLAVKNTLGTKHVQANRCTQFIRRLFNWAAAAPDGQVNFWPCSNPAKDVTRHKEKPRERYLQPDELARYNAAITNEPCRDLKDFLILASATAARRENIFAMRWANIRWEEAVWKVPYSKSGESYNCALSRTALAILKARQAEAPEDAIYVFPGVGRSGHMVSLYKPWKAFIKRAQLVDFTIHDIRRTTASYMAVGGVPLQQIALALGHSDKNMQSVTVYAKLHSSAEREARETGERKMRELMAKAKRRKLAAKPGRPQLVA